MTSKTGSEPWEATFEVAGSLVAVRCFDEAIAADVGRLLAVIKVDAPMRAADHVVTIGDHRRARVAAASGMNVLDIDGTRHWILNGRSGLLRALVNKLNRVVLATTSHLAVHAGVVSSGGAAVAFPGASETGKSTLTAACLLAGFDYVSDEALLLDLGRTVAAYPKPLGLSAWTCSAVRLDPDPEGGDRLVSPTDLGAKPADRPLRLDHVILRCRQPGAPRLQELPSIEAVAVLMRYSFNRAQRADSLDVVEEVARGCNVWELSWDDPLAAAHLLCEVLICD